MSWVRARQMQMLLAHIDRLPEADRRAVWARIDPAHVVRVQNATPLEWIPMAISTSLARAVIETLGRERSRAFFKDQFAATLSNAVLGSLVAAITRHLSADPRPGLRWLARGHDLLFKGVGKLTVQTEPGKPEAIFTLSELPEELVNDSLWLDRYAWSAASMQILWRATTECEVIETRPEERTAKFRMWWSEPKRAHAP
jgi:hypothetical protein